MSEANEDSSDLFNSISLIENNANDSSINLAKNENGLIELSLDLLAGIHPKLIKESESLSTKVEFCEGCKKRKKYVVSIQSKNKVRFLCSLICIKEFMKEYKILIEKDINIYKKSSYNVCGQCKEPISTTYYIAFFKKFCNDVCLSKYCWDNHSNCYFCGNRSDKIDIGKYCFYRYKNFYQVCSTSCQLLLKQSKFCHFCGKRFLSTEEIFSAMISKVLKNFCNNHCYRSYVIFNENTDHEKRHCAICQEYDIRGYFVEIQLKAYKIYLCNNVCFYVFFELNSLLDSSILEPYIVCMNCRKIFLLNNKLSMTFNPKGILFPFCSELCKWTMISKSGQGVIPCTFCLSKKHYYDLFHYITPKGIEAYCSIRCRLTKEHPTWNVDVQIAARKKFFESQKQQVLEKEDPNKQSAKKQEEQLRLAIEPQQEQQLQQLEILNPIQVEHPQLQQQPPQQEQSQQKSSQEQPEQQSSQKKLQSPLQQQRPLQQQSPLQQQQQRLFQRKSPSQLQQRPPQRHSPLQQQRPLQQQSPLQQQLQQRPLQQQSPLQQQLQQRPLQQQPRLQQQQSALQQQLKKPMQQQLQEHQQLQQQQQLRQLQSQQQRQHSLQPPPPYQPPQQQQSLQILQQQQPLQTSQQKSQSQQQRLVSNQESQNMQPHSQPQSLPYPFVFQPETEGHQSSRPRVILNTNTSLSACDQPFQQQSQHRMHVQHQPILIQSMCEQQQLQPQIHYQQQSQYATLQQNVSQRQYQQPQQQIGYAQYSSLEQQQQKQQQQQQMYKQSQQPQQLQRRQNTTQQIQRQQQQQQLQQQQQQQMHFSQIGQSDLSKYLNLMQSSNISQQSAQQQSKTMQGVNNYQSPQLQQNTQSLSSLQSLTNLTNIQAAPQQQINLLNQRNNFQSSVNSDLMGQNVSSNVNVTNQSTQQHMNILSHSDLINQLMLQQQQQFQQLQLHHKQLAMNDNITTTTSTTTTNNNNVVPNRNQQFTNVRSPTRPFRPSQIYNQHLSMSSPNLSSIPTQATNVRFTQAVNSDLGTKFDTLLSPASATSSNILSDLNTTSTSSPAFESVMQIPTHSIGVQTDHENITNEIQAFIGTMQEQIQSENMLVAHMPIYVPVPLPIPLPLPTSYVTSRYVPLPFPIPLPYNTEYAGIEPLVSVGTANQPVISEMEHRIEEITIEDD